MLVFFAVGSEFTLDITEMMFYSSATYSSDVSTNRIDDVVVASCRKEGGTASGLLVKNDSQTGDLP